MTKLTDFLQQIRDRLPLSAVVARHVSLKKKGREHSGLCPFHNEKGASFTVNDEKEFYHCFGCGAHGDHFAFITGKLNLPFMESVTYLAEQAGLVIPKFDRPDGEPGQSFEVTPREENLSLYEINEATAQWYQDQLRTPAAAFVREYLKKRGMTGQIALKFRVGYAPDHGLKEFLLGKGFSILDIQKCGLIIEPENRNKSPYDRFRSRVMFPIQDQRGRVVAFGGRIIHQGEPKYLNSPDTPLFNKGKLLYGLNHSLPRVRAKKPEGMPFVVVEGYMDVIALHQAGITSAVAPLGTALTPEQIQLMWRSCPQPILCFDGDAAGRRAAYRAVDRVLAILKPGGYTLNYCFLPEGEDPDSLLQKSSKAMYDLLSRPMELVDVLWQIFMEQRLLTTPEQKAKAKGDLTNLVKEIKDPELKNFFWEDLNAKLQQKLQSQKESKDWGVKNWVPRNVPIQQNLLQNPLIRRHLSGFMQKKNVFGEKILLAILINHPTLISEVVEQLMTLPSQGTLEGEELLTLRQFLIDFCAQYPDGDNTQLKIMLSEKGFDPIVRQLLTRDIYDMARFAHPSTPLDQVMEGWQEVWRSLQTTQNLKDEVKMTSSELKSSLNEQSWERLKLLKTHLL